MVRMNRPMGPFWRAKTCSTAARTADLRALARGARHRLAFGLFAMNLRSQRPGQTGVLHLLLRAASEARYQSSAESQISFGTI